MSTFGKNLDRQAQDLAYNIYLFFKAKTMDPNSTECKKNMKLIPTVAEATGLSENTILKIIMDRTSQTDEDTQNKPKKMVRYLVLDKLTECDIRRRVILFYPQYKKAPTLKALHTTFVDQNVLISSSASLRRFLTKNGFKYIHFKNKPKILMERGGLQSTRSEYLRQLNIYRESGKPIIYVGDIYISVTQKANQENSNLLNREGGFIVLHAGDDKGFLNVVQFITYTKLSHLHAMNPEKFKWWVRVKVLPNLPPHSVVVMNNTYYNSDSVKPGNRAPKCEIKAWLSKREVPFEENVSKHDLIALVDNHQSCGDNTLNDIINKAGHEVLRIPAVHADLNPLEWVLAKMKRELWSEEQFTWNVGTKQAFIEQAFLEFTQTDWQKYQHKVKSIELEFFKHDANLEQTTEEMLEKINSDEIILEDEDSDSDSNEEMEIRVKLI